MEDVGADWVVADCEVDPWRQVQDEGGKAAPLHANPAKAVNDDLEISQLEVCTVQVDFVAFEAFEYVLGIANRRVFLLLLCRRLRQRRSPDV